MTDKGIVRPIVWGTVGLAFWLVLAINPPAPRGEPETGYCQVGLLNVGVVTFAASAEECARIHQAIQGRLDAERKQQRINDERRGTE